MPRRHFNRLKLATVAFLSVFVLLGCQSQPVHCPYQNHKPLIVANAGCLSVDENQLLVIRQRSGRISLPGGGAEKNESAQCTAYRETVEETGLYPEVGELLVVFDNGFHLFQCHLRSSSTPVPLDIMEVSEAFWLPVAKMHNENWRFPNQLVQLYELAKSQ